MPDSPHQRVPDRAEPPPPLVAISLGDPAGIGPEIVCKSLQSNALREKARFVLLGDLLSLKRAAESAGIPPFWEEISPGAPSSIYTPAAGEVLAIETGGAVETGVRTDWPATDSAAGGRVSFGAVERAIELVKRARGDALRAEAIVTAPISKASWDRARREAPDATASARFGPIGKGFPGHTELLADRFGAEKSAMLFVGPTMRVILVTIHVPLARVPELITPERVLDTIELADRACREMGLDSPRLAVCGLNPHAGEGGLLGMEDRERIAPGVERARAKGIDVRGPLPADTLFGKAHLVNGRRKDAQNGYDCIVAMYHDQGLIPVKLADPLGTVNVTVGLSWNGEGVIRTSPAHGTAFDIAGRNLADPTSMTSAISLAIEMAERRARRDRAGV